MEVPYYIKQFGFACLLILALCLPFSCNEDNEKDNKQNPPQENPADSAQTVTENPTTTVELGESVRKEMLEKQEKEAMARFEVAFVKDSKDPYTWQEWLKVCNFKAELEKEDVFDCYDRFFNETKDIKIDENSMSTALRWRIILALQADDAVNSRKYWNKLAPIEKAMVKQGRMRLEVQAYSASIHSGILSLEDKMEEAVIEAGRAIKLFKLSNVDDAETLLDYYDKLIKFQSSIGMWKPALESLEEQEKVLIKKFGQINPMVAVNRLKRISILLNIDDKQGAIALWDYVYKILGRYKKDELPPEIDKLYVETMVRLDVAGVLP